MLLKWAIIYISCYVKTFGAIDYIVIYDSYDGGYTKSKAEALKDSYWSDFNKGISGKRTSSLSYIKCDSETADFIHEGIGAGLVVIQKCDMSIFKVFYFKDFYNIRSEANFIAITENNHVVVSHGEYCYVFKEGYYEGLHFVNPSKYKTFGNYWILYPTYGYDANCNWQLVDFIEKKVFSIPFNFEPSNDETLDIYLNIRDKCFCFDYGDRVNITFDEIIEREC